MAQCISCTVFLSFYFISIALCHSPYFWNETQRLIQLKEGWINDYNIFSEINGLQRGERKKVLLNELIFLPCLYITCALSPEGLDSVRRFIIAIPHSTTLDDDDVCENCLPVFSSGDTLGLHTLSRVTEAGSSPRKHKEDKSPKPWVINSVSYPASFYLQCHLWTGS